MTNEIIACGNGCREADASGVLQPRLTEDGRAICEPCCDRLWKALADLPDLYVRLYAAILPGSVDQNPETKATKRVNAPAPLRIDPIDLYDERHILIGGSLPLENVRGVVGELQRWANSVRVQQSAATNPRPTLLSELKRLRDSFDYLTRQPWAPQASKAVQSTVREVKDAVGIYRGRPVGTCPTVVHDTDDSADVGEICSGALFPNAVGVRCVKCGAVWTPGRLATLGRMLA